MDTSNKKTTLTYKQFYLIHMEGSQLFQDNFHKMYQMKTMENKNKIYTAVSRNSS